MNFKGVSINRLFEKLKGKSQKPVYSIKPLIIKDIDGVIDYNQNNKIYTIRAKPINSNIVQAVRFTDWKVVKNLFDKESIKIIETFIKNVKNSSSEKT